MAGRGISCVILSNNHSKPILLYKRYYDVIWNDTWTENINADRKNNEMTILWKKLTLGVTDTNSVVKALVSAPNIVTQRIIGFQANGNNILLRDLYPQKGEYLCFFKKEDKKWSLYQVGAKTLNELKAVGYDHQNQAHVPLVAFAKQMSDGTKQYVFPNF